jgi:hypothetical protein
MAQEPKQAETDFHSAVEQTSNRLVDADVTGLPIL